MIVFLGCSSPSDISRARILVISGNNQSGTGDQILPLPIVIEITDMSGLPLSGIEADFRVVEGTGRITGSPSHSTDQEGRIQINWQISSGYNGIEISLDDPNSQSSPAYIWATGENPRGIFKTASIATLEQIDEKLYSITIYGDYSEVLEEVNNRFVNNAASPREISPPKQCSLFSAFGDSRPYFMGRSYDNPVGWNCLTLVLRTSSPDGHSTISLNRMRDYGFHPNTDFNQVPFIEKTRIFEAVFFTPDGINEHGVSAGCAGVEVQHFIPDPGKQSIWLTYLIRKIIDHTRNIDEVVKLVRKYNIFESSLDSCATHFLAADSSGRSLILELDNGEWQVSLNDRPYQVITNSPSFNVPIDSQIAACWRFEIIYPALEEAQGNISLDEAMNILERIKFAPPGTQWSSLYNLNQKKMSIALNCNFDYIYHFTL